MIYGSKPAFSSGVSNSVHAKGCGLRLAVELQNFKSRFKDTVPQKYQESLNKISICSFPIQM